MLLVAGGHIGFWTWLPGSLFAAVAVGVGAISLRPPPPDEKPAGARRHRARAADLRRPGSLGGTESALRR